MRRARERGFRALLLLLLVWAGLVAWTCSTFAGVFLRALDRVILTFLCFLGEGDVRSMRSSSKMLASLLNCIGVSRISFAATLLSRRRFLKLLPFLALS